LSSLSRQGKVPAVFLYAPLILRLINLSRQEEGRALQNN